MRKSVLAIPLLSLWIVMPLAARAATVDECIFPRPVFEQGSPEAVIAAQTGSKAAIHRTYPPLCDGKTQGLCGKQPYLLPGDHVQVARRCADWVLSRFVGKSQTTEGWVEAAQLQGPLPPDSVGASQAPADPLKVPDCAHDVSIMREIHRGTRGVVPGRQVTVYHRNPLLCTSADAGLCGSEVTQVDAGSTAFYGPACGAWVFIEPRDEHSAHTSGWVKMQDVKPIPDDGPPPVLSDWHFPYGDDPLYLAVSSGKMDEVRRLIAGGRDPNAPITVPYPPREKPRRSDTWSFLVLSVAIEQKNLDMVQLLLSLGADPKLHDPRWKKTCDIAMAVDKSEKIVEALAKAGADVNCDRGIPLQVAIDMQGPEVLPSMKALLAAHADPNIDNDRGGLLYDALGRNNVAAFQLLMAAGGDPNAPFFRIGPAEPPLFTAMDKYPYHWDPSIILLLLNAGADPNKLLPTPDWPDTSDHDEIQVWGQTPLTFAAESGYFEVVRMLLQHGADPRKARADGKLPAELAAEQGSPEMVALLTPAAKN